MSILTRAVFSNILRSPKHPFLLSRFCLKGGQKRTKSRINAYVLSKYVTLMKIFENNLKKYFPEGAKFYEIFSVGIKYFKSDCSILFSAFKKIKSRKWDSLSRKEIEVYNQLPKEMIRAAPALIIASTVPFGAIALVLTFNFSRQFLTYHFWSLQQRIEFALFTHKNKLRSYKPLFRFMEYDLGKIKDKPLHNEMNEIIQCLKNGDPLSKDLILSCKALFEKNPFGLAYLSTPHIIFLLQVYGLHTGWKRIPRLERRALILKLMDGAIVREGGVEKLTQEEIIWNCFARGLNPINMKQEDIIKWMNIWLSISEEVDEKSYSLLLHCPILLGYNEPSNWKLLHDL